MPFTFSHPAIILPIYKVSSRRLSLTGLVAGSVVPDFEYFIHMRIQSNLSHTFTGILLFDLPVGILLTFIFHNIIRNQLFNNLPLFLKRRVVSFEAFNWNSYFIQHWTWIIVSVIIGAFSHLLWDGVTHNHGIFVNLFPVLSRDVDLMGYHIVLYRLLQHISTIAGGVAIVFVILDLPETNTDHYHYNLRYWPLVFLISSMIVTLRFFVKSEEYFLVQLVVSIISATIAALIIVPYLINRNKIKS